MNLSFADTLYFKKENILEIILGLHRSYKSLQREIQTCCEIYQLTFNELLVLLEIRKGFNKKVDIANRIYIKKQNLNLIIKDLQKKVSKDLLTKKLEDLRTKKSEVILTTIILVLKKYEGLRTV